MTQRRTSGKFVSKKNGKGTSLTYNDLAFSVDNGNKFEKLYTYLFPSKINGFQRILGNNGKFKYTLNNDMVYDLLVVGMKDGEFFYFEKTSLNEGNFGNISLEALTEGDLDKRINGLNKRRLNASSSKMHAELAWLFKEKKNYKEQKLRAKMASFRNTLRAVIFPCGVQDIAPEKGLQFFDDNEEDLEVSE
jgi:hypothetical protein